MIKRKLCILIAFSFLLTGCSSLNMSQAESGQVAEYIAYAPKTPIIENKTNHFHLLNK